MRKLVLIFLLLPFITNAQPAQEDYNIYSEFLEAHTIQHQQAKISFAIRSYTANFSDKTFSAHVSMDDISESAAYLRNHADKFMYTQFHNVDKEVLKDPLWAPVMEHLKILLKGKTTLKNRFAAGLDISIMNDSRYNSYFSGFDPDVNWERFHEDYPMPSAVVQFSSISTDGIRAIFYASTRCGVYAVPAAWCFLKKMVIRGNILVQRIFGTIDD